MEMQNKPRIITQAKITAIGYNKNNDPISRVILTTKPSDREIHLFVSIINNDQMYRVLDNKKYGLSFPVEIFTETKTDRVNYIDEYPVPEDLYQKILKAKNEIEDLKKFTENIFLIFSVEEINQAQNPL